MDNPVIPAPETLHQKAEAYIKDSELACAGDQPYGGDIVSDLLAESRRLAGEVERLQQELSDYEVSYCEAHGPTPKVCPCCEAVHQSERAEQLAGEVAQLQQQVAALTPPDIDEDACSFAVLAARMSRAGYSYDAKEGIWWKDDSRPGILDAAIKRAEAAEGEVARLREQIQGATNG